MLRKLYLVSPIKTILYINCHVLIGLWRNFRISFGHYTVLVVSDRKIEPSVVGSGATTMTPTHFCGRGIFYMYVLAFGLTTEMSINVNFTNDSLIYYSKPSYTVD